MKKQVEVLHKYCQCCDCQHNKDCIQEQEAELAALRKDRERLDSGKILLNGTLYTGQNLRAAIDDAMQEEPAE